MTSSEKDKNYCNYLREYKDNTFYIINFKRKQSVVINKTFFEFESINDEIINSIENNENPIINNNNIIFSCDKYRIYAKNYSLSCKEIKEISSKLVDLFKHFLD